MSEVVRVLGLDMGFENTGWAVLAASAEWEVLDCNILVTTKINKKRGIYQADDDMRRAGIIGAYLQKLVEDYEPDIVAFESRTSVRSNVTSGKLGMAYGALAALLHCQQLSRCSMLPQEVKRELTGGKATKAEIEEAVRLRTNGWQSVETLAPSRRHHVYDAIAVALAAGRSDVFNATRAALQKDRGNSR